MKKEIQIRKETTNWIFYEALNILEVLQDKIREQMNMCAVVVSIHYWPPNQEKWTKINAF